MPKSGSSRTAQTESSDSNSNMVEKQTGRKNKEKVTSYNRTPKIDRSELEKEVKEKTSMKRKLPFTVSPSRSEQRESDTDSDPGHSSEAWGERLIPPYRTYSEKEGPEKKKMKKEPGSKKSVPVCKATLGGILIGYPLSERQQMALVMQMTARDNSPDSTPNHPSQATPGQKKTPSSSSRQKDKVNKRNERGETPLHMAAIRGETKQVKELISQGADVNVKDFAGWTPLHEACNLGYYDVAKQLILAGADVNTRGLENDTPLHDAASNGHRDIVKLLLRNGGDAYQMNHRGERPVDVADSDEMEQLLKGELPLSDDDDDDDSCTESEELPSVNPSSVDDNVDDSEAEKELKTDTNQQLTPCKSITSSALDEYEFKDDDDEDIDEEEEQISKLVDQKRIRRRDGKKSVVKENSYLTPPKLEFQKPFKIKKQKSARVLVSSSSDSSDEEPHQEKKTCSTSSLEIVPDSSKSDARTRKENLISLEQKEKGKGKKKVKKQSKNKENQEFKEEKEEKENAKLMLFSTCSALDSLDRSRDEDSFKKSLKDDSSGHQFHLSTAKSPKHSCSLNEKRAKPLKQENAKTGLSSGAAEITFQSEVVRFDHLTDSDYTSESSSNKSFKYNTKTKHRKKDLSIEFGEKSGQRSKEEETGIFDNMEEVFKKTDKDGKVIKKHKLKHKDKEKNKIKKEHENEKGKHRQKESEKIYPEFDREYWKENFFKNDDTNETFKDENSNMALTEKPLKDKTVIKEDKVSKEKYFKEEKPFKEDREKDKSKKSKKEKHYKEEKEKLSNLEERKEIVLADKDDSLYSSVFLKKEHVEFFEKEKGTDKEKSDTPDKEKKENKEKSEKKSPTKERDLERLERKYFDREKKVKHENRSEKEKSETHEKLQEKSFSKLQEIGERTKEKDRSGSLYSTSEKIHRENDKLKNVFSVKKLEEKEKSKEKLDKKHEREKIERERHSSGIKDKVEKEKHANEKKAKFSEKDSQDSILSKADKVKVKEKERDIEKEKKKEKSRERESDPVTNSKHLHDEKKRSTIESSKGYHDKLCFSKDKSKEDFPKTPETKEKEKKEKDRQKDKVPVNASVKAKLKEPEADKLKSKDSGATKDVRPKEKRLVNDDLMQTSFERMLSLKDLEIEQWHKKHKEKIKMKEKERQRHRSGIDLSKIKEREKLKSSSTSKELTRSKSSDPSEMHLKDKQPKDVNSVKSLTNDTKQNLPETPRPLLSCEGNLTASPRQERDRMGLTSRSISMISVASSEDSCQTSAVATPRPLTDYDSDFTIEGSESQSSFSQSVFLPNAKSPAVYDRDCDVLTDLPDRLKSPHSSKLPGSYLRSVSADNARCENECRSVGDVRRCSMPVVANDHDKQFHKQLEANLPLSSEKQYSFSPTVQSQVCTSPRSEPLPDSGPEEGACNSTSCLQSPAVIVPNDTNYLSQDTNPSSIIVQSTSQQMPMVQPQLNCLISDIQPEKPIEVSYDRLDVPSHSNNDGYTTTAACEKNAFNPLPHVPQEWSCTEQLTSELASKSPQRLCSESSQAVNLLETPSYSSPTHSSNSSCTRSPLDSDSAPRVLFWQKCGGTQEESSQTQTLQDIDQSSTSCKPHSESSGMVDEKDGKYPPLDINSDLANQKTLEDPSNDFKPSELQVLEENSSTPSAAALPDGSSVNENLVDHTRTVQSLLIEEKMEGTKSTILGSHEPACNQESSQFETVPVTSVDEMQSEPKEELPEATSSTADVHTPPVIDQSQFLESKAQDQDSSLDMEVSQHFTTAGQDPVIMHEPALDEQKPSAESTKEESEDRMETDRIEHDIPQRITRNRANILANQSKQPVVNCAQVSDKDTESATPVKSKSKLSEEEEGQVHHPHKRKLSRVPHPTQVKSTLQQAKEKTQQSLAAIVDSLKLEEIQPYHSEKANPYYEYLHIRKKIEEKRKVLCSVTPQAPQFYDEFVTFTGSYLLDGNPLSKLCIPTITPPPSLSEALKELFRQQEVIRMKLRLQHSIEREKLIMSNEQEVLRVHYRAARTLANQTLPFSACTVLLDAEVYNMPQDPQGDENKTSVRDRFNARQFMSWLQDVDDKFDKLKTCLLMRQQHEAAAMNAVQRLEWQLKLQELDPSSHKSLSIFEIPEFYIPLVDVNDDFDLTPI
ncbi:ankyrin repeat domain-containing protein 12 isoform X1 [Hemitrygon akajei]|uniref:ankyrin repeat domain-containing protein 12 isoform X1 n=1 Tax=Hemitrygon akajei TaxID=2704970 RepID=UPI003BF942E8